MRLRKKNVSRVAAVAVAAVMAVSAAAPAAFAAAPVANGGTAVVQENTKVVGINYYCWEENRSVGTQEVTVNADATHVNSTQLTAPTGYVLDVSGDPEINDGWAFVDVKKVAAPATQDVEVTFYDYKNDKTAGTQIIPNVSADQTTIATSELTLPEGYEFETEKDSYDILNGYVSVAVVKKAVAPATQDVEVVFYDYKNKETAGKQIITNVSADKTSVAASELKLPEGYEFETEKASYDILNGYVNVAVVKKAVATTKVVKINFYSEAEKKQIAEPRLIVAANATSVNSSELTAPKGYELCETGDFAIRDGYVYVAVRKATTKVVKINFYSEAEKKQIAEPKLTVAADATSVNSSALTAPEGYELCETGDFAIRDGYVYVPVRKATTKVVKINFYSEDEEKQIEEPELTVAADATSVNSSALTAPKGYELCEVGDFAIRDGYVYVPVRKATTKVVKINFYSEDENKQIAEPELTVAADATSVNSSALTAPEGYELCEVGDFAIRDGYVYVAVRKVTTPDPVDPTPTPDPEPTPAPTVNPVTTALGVGAWLLALGGLILGFFGL